MGWEVEGTDHFAEWFVHLSEDEQVDVGRVVELLVEHGPSLPFPYSSGIGGSRHRHMRELRIQHAGDNSRCRVRNVLAHSTATGPHPVAPSSFHPGCSVR